VITNLFQQDDTGSLVLRYWGSNCFVFYQ